MVYTLGQTILLSAAYSSTPTDPLAVLQPPSSGTPIPVTLVLAPSGMYQALYTIPSNAVFGSYSILYTGTLNGIPEEAGGGTFEVEGTNSISPGGTSYCQPSDLRARLSLLTVDLYSDPVLQALCDQVSDRIDNSLRKRYVVPFTAPYDGTIVRIAISLAAGLAVEVVFQGDAAADEPKLALTMRKLALNDLDELSTPDAKGRYKMSLDLVEVSTMGDAHSHWGRELRWADKTADNFGGGRIGMTGPIGYLGFSQP